MRILVIDDDKSILEFLRRLFEKHEHEVIVSESSDQGLKMLVEAKPDLVLLDIMLPKKDGIAVLKEIKILDKEVTVVMITAYKDAERVIESFRFGAMDCLLKPFNIEYILNTVLPRIKNRQR